MFKFTAELDRCTAGSLFSHFRADSSSASKLQFFFFFLISCTRGAESLSGFNLKPAALVLTNGPSWFFGKILLTLSSPPLAVEWIIHFARFYF